MQSLKKIVIRKSFNMKQLLKNKIVGTSLFLFALWFVSLPCKAAQQEEIHEAPTDSIRLSLLTCAPGEEIYSLFGHTAIRYEYPQRGIDVVFNYGMFSFNTPNFMFRFALGETDYELGVTNYERFAAEYAFFGRSVWQQTLNLTTPEKEKLINLLEENYRPANRTYRYNFFYDNCATRPRDKVEESIHGELLYDQLMEGNEQKSFRDILHQYTEGHPWAQFGIDFCVGSEADKPITDRLMTFAPFYLMDYFKTANITINGNVNRPLVSRTDKVVVAQPIEPDMGFEITPLQAALILFILIVAATIYGIKKQKSLWGLDIALFSVAGIAGCVIAFLAIFSQHPAVSVNYLLFVFHPLHLLCLPFFIYQERKGKRSWYHTLNCIVLTLFILLFLIIPQRIDLAVVPLALCLLVRSASNLILTYKRKK